MNYWIISDTHFGHAAMETYCGRPKNFANIILKNLSRTVKENDVLVHLGDFCFGDEEKWHYKFMKIPGTKWLIKGNHDKKSNQFYLKNGWDFVGDGMVLNMFGERIFFTHEPLNFTSTSILNIHGHQHNRLSKVRIQKILVSMENNNYQPYSLRKLIL